MAKWKSKRPAAPPAVSPAAAAAPGPLPPASRLTKACVGFGFLLLLVAYWSIFGGFFPGPGGGMGHDYSYFLPNLLDGYVWYRVNGLWEVPWFTPSFGGGSLVFPNVQRAYYSVPQFLTFWVDPLTAIKTTVLLFAAIGGGGFYLLLRQAFRTTAWAAFFGAGVFLFNGFYANRMLIGHFGYHTYMLMPLVAYLLLRPLPPDALSRRWQFLFDTGAAGAMFALMAVSDFISLMIPAILSIIMIGLVHGVFYAGRRRFWAKLGGAGLIGLLISLPKLTAVAYFMDLCPRTEYSLPGVDGFWSAAWLVLRSLLVSAFWDRDRGTEILNAQWPLARHEWEFSITFVPFLFILYMLVKMGAKIGKTGFAFRLTRVQWIQVAALAAFAVVPIAVNIYSPWWNALLEQLPVIGSSSSLFRWFVAYVPCVILASALIIEKTPLRNFQAVVVYGSLAVMVLAKSMPDRTYYARQAYDPRPVVEAYRQIKSGQLVPRVTHMGYYVDEKGMPISPLNRNDMFIRGCSQIYCYESIFGYAMENRPMKTLHAGPAMDVTKGFLNVKNPACYLWPEENGGTFGGHFTVAQKDDARAFLSYRPFHFHMPLPQRMANMAGLAALFLLVLFFMVYAGRGGWAVMREKMRGISSLRSGAHPA